MEVAGSTPAQSTNRNIANNLIPIISKTSKSIVPAVLWLILLPVGLFLAQNKTKTNEYKPIRLYPLKIGNAGIGLELKVTDNEKYRGLSLRPSLPQNQGMLFVFDKPEKYSFFIRDMKFPLDIIWIDENYKITEIMRNLPIDSPAKPYMPKSPAKYVLEANAGWSQKNKIAIGQTVPIGKVLSKESILYDVPFTPQAPFGNWKDRRQAAGCEEATGLMAVSWANATTLSRNQAEKEIISISEYELKNQGYFIDTSANDTAQIIIKGWFGYENFEVKNNINAENIKTELRKGNIIIAPVNGRKLKNPYYTPPGPIQHQLLIIGYDATTKEFIVNDSGTKRGEHFRYQEDILDKALQDYPSGNHKPIKSVERTMIVVKPKN